MSCIGVIGDLEESGQFEWKIPDFFSLSSERTCFYNSPCFVFKNTSLHLKLYPGGNTHSGFLALFLVNDTYRPIRVSASFHIKKVNGDVALTKQSFEFLVESDYGFNQLYKRSDLQEYASEFVPTGILTIICKLNPKQEGNQATTKAGNLDLQRFIGLDVLSKNLRELFTNKNSCDVTLQVEDKEFKAHKLILMARSPVFAAMFQHDTLEKQTGVINIPDCDSESFQKFLDYLYCGKLEDISFECVFHLFVTSNKYDVQELKEFCSKYLIESLTVDNVCDIVKLADKCDEGKLMNETQNFIYQNWNKIFLSAEWDRLMTNNLLLAKKILAEMAKIKSSE